MKKKDTPPQPKEWLRKRDCIAIIFGAFPIFFLIFGFCFYIQGRASQQKECGLHRFTLLDLTPGDVVEHKLMLWKGVVLKNQEGPMMTIRWESGSSNGIQDFYDVEWKIGND